LNVLGNVKPPHILNKASGLIVEGQAKKAGGQ
jgi:hypothetical protein